MLSGNIITISNALLSLPKEGLIIFLKSSTTLILFQGFLKIASDSGLVSKFVKVVNFMLKPLFPKVRQTEIFDYISLNLICNFFGIGQAATGAGMKAMKLMNIDGKCNQEMITFLTLNVSSLCMIPQSVIALRIAYFSAYSTSIIVPCLVVGFLTLIFTIIINLYLIKHEN